MITHILALFVVLILAVCVGYGIQQIWRRKFKKYDLDEHLREYFGNHR